MFSNYIIINIIQHFLNNQQYFKTVHKYREFLSLKIFVLLLIANKNILHCRISLDTRAF